MSYHTYHMLNQIFQHHYRKISTSHDRWREAGIKLIQKIALSQSDHSSLPILVSHVRANRATASKNIRVQENACWLPLPFHTAWLGAGFKRACREFNMYMRYRSLHDNDKNYERLTVNISYSLADQPLAVLIAKHAPNFTSGGISGLG